MNDQRNGPASRLLARLISTIAKPFGLVPIADLKETLDQGFGMSIAKRLDEHREVVEEIERHTGLLSSGYWHAVHLASQDDYLMRVYHLVHGQWPEQSSQYGIFPRRRPAALGECELPEYTRDIRQGILQQPARTAVVTEQPSKDRE